MAAHDGYRYWAPIDRSAPNNPHSIALRMIGRNRDILELGCASGHVTQALKEQGCTVVGVERDEQAARAASLIADEVLVTDLFVPEDLSKVLADRMFDVVYAGDVLEHLPDPVAVLAAARAALRPDGSVVVSVPNIAHVDVRLLLLAGRFDYHDYGLLDRTHLRFFTKATLLEMLEDVGLRVVELQRVHRPPFESELAVRPADVPDGVLEHVLHDPEAQTYQFVVRAVLDDDTAELDQMSQRVLETDSRLAEERAVRLRLERERLALEEQVAQLEVRSRELDAVLATRTFRATAGLRRLYSMFRGSR